MLSNIREKKVVRGLGSVVREKQEASTRLDVILKL